jgi:dihydroneopterin aldolase
MGIISVKGIRLYCHHGCLPQETRIGSDYMVDVDIETDLKASALSDDLSKTIDYVVVNQVVQQEMDIPSKLLETVALRIINRLTNLHGEIDFLAVSISKLNPPINGDVERVTIKEIYKKLV